MWWLVVLAPLLLVLIAVWVPVKLAASASVDDTRIVLQARASWAFWQLWRWPVPTAAARVSQAQTAKTQPAADPEQTPATAPVARAKRAAHRSPPFDFVELWPLLKRYWKPALNLLHHRFAGDLRLELADAALTGWLFAAAGATGWPPAALRLELSFGQTNRLVGEVHMSVWLYPAEVIGLMLRLACEPPIRRRILQAIQSVVKKGDKQSGGSETSRRTVGASHLQQDGDR